jgi:anti-sigma28 factor (negative regulator of flagellin synthesis)
MGHHFDPHEDAMLRLSPGALAARAQRLQRLKALVEAGLYRVDAASLARALLRPAMAGMSGRLLDRAMPA